MLPATSSLVSHHFQRVLLAEAEARIEREGVATEIEAVRAEAGRAVPEAPLPAGEDKARAVRSMFDSIAPRYDLVNRIMTFGMDIGWRRRAVAGLSLRPGDVVIDVACGTGDFCREIQRAGGQAFGLDVSLGMLQKARTSAPLAQADGLRMPLPGWNRRRDHVRLRAAQRGRYPISIRRVRTRGSTRRQDRGDRSGGAEEQSAPLRAPLLLPQGRPEDRRHALGPRGVQLSPALDGLPPADPGTADDARQSRLRRGGL